MKIHTLLVLTLLPTSLILADSSFLRIWPEQAPGSEGLALELLTEERSTEPDQHNRVLSQIQTPQLELFRPEKPNGTAVLICPGGGYRYLAYDHEGVVIAKRLNEHGITAFVLSYRLPGEGHDNRSWVPLQDAQRALRTIRYHAEDWEIDPLRIGVMGFSAGGHLASTLGTQFERQSYPARDALDAVSARPDFMILLYPVISMHPDVTHMGSRTQLLGTDPDPSMEKQFSNALQVSVQTPPTFVALANDDGAVIPQNSLEFVNALLLAKVPVELHSFEKGGHGFGIRRASGPTQSWPDLLIAWMQDREL